MSSWGEADDVKFDQEIMDALTNDLDTPRAMQRLRVIEKDSSMGAQDKRAIFIFADQVLGLDLKKPEAQRPLPAEAHTLLEKRAQARLEKNWEQSDSLRAQLESLGLEIKDGPDGQSWNWM
jgi:cysteinyl-tRNA synthetase